MLLDWKVVAMGKVVLLFLCMVLVVVSLACADSIEKLEVQKHLKNLNRPPVRSIKVERGIEREREFFFLSLNFCYDFYFSLAFAVYDISFFCLFHFFTDGLTVFLIGVCNNGPFSG